VKVRGIKLIGGSGKELTRDLRTGWRRKDLDVQKRKNGTARAVTVTREGRRYSEPKGEGLWAGELRPGAGGMRSRRRR
jgi:hypothetical protein